MQTQSTAPAPDVLPLAECLEDRAASIGGKALGLGALLRYGLPVPPGFAVTADAFRRSIIDSGLDVEIARLLEQSGTYGGDAAASSAIEELFTEDILGADVAEAIEAAYTGLGREDVPVAVRSSATAEDTAEASFAGQQYTYLGIRGVSEVRRHVVRCWASLFTPHAIAYRRRFEIPADGLAMAVVVQRMVAAEAAGVMMTLEPVTGDRSQIYIESAIGLGEGVVRGDVGVDRLWVRNTDLRLVREEIGHKDRAHTMDARTGDVQVVDVAPDRQDERSLSPNEVAAVAELGRLVESRFGRPMDVEWALGPGVDQPRELFLLQARPETVWSQRPDPAQIDPADAWDPLHTASAPHEHWSRGNIGEAIPGVQTPLSWTTWADGIEIGTRSSLRAIGALPADDARTPADPAQRYLRCFYGRPAILVDFLASLGDSMPGTTGEVAVLGILGEVPPTISFSSTRRRYPAVAWRLPRAFATTPNRARRAAAETEAWYAEAIRRAGTLDLAATRRAYADGRSRFNAAMAMQILVLLSNVQPLFDAITQLVERTGVGDVGVLSGSGGAEMAIVSDIWSTAHGHLPMEELIRRHGFHGPAEGELSSSVWREDATPLHRLVRLYADRPKPGSGDEAAERAAMQRALLAAVPAWQRPTVRHLLRLAERRILLRGICKRSFLQSLDVCRAMARRTGDLLAGAGVLADEGDVFFLTADELIGGEPADVQELIRRRRERWEVYRDVELPQAWRGVPRPVAPSIGDEATDGDDALQGTGVSSGTVTGRVRVVHDPSFAEVEPGEVLVAPITDPSWSSIMFLSAALVVDIGGALSHAAVVAREMRIPCVVNTRNGTRRLRTGDLVRVDGATGRVTVLERRKEQ